MYIKIVYATMTQHTKKLADYIAKDMNLTAEDVKNNPKVGKADVLIMGTGIYSGNISEDLINYVKTLNKGDVKKAIIFIDSSSGKDASADLKTLLKEKKIDVYPEVFTCKAQWLFFNRKHPDEADCVFLKKFVEDALKKL